MENINIGNLVYKVTITYSDGAYDYYYTVQDDGTITDKCGLDKTKSFIDGKYNATNATTEIYAEPKELTNTPKYISALAAHGLTEAEAIICLKNFFNRCNGKTYKKVAREIMEEATYTYMTYDTPHPPKGYYNSFLDNIRGIDNVPA